MFIELKIIFFLKFFYFKGKDDIFSIFIQINRDHNLLLSQRLFLTFNPFK
jgi:hypothetical protein